MTEVEKFWHEMMHGKIDMPRQFAASEELTRRIMRDLQQQCTTEGHTFGLVTSISGPLVKCARCGFMKSYEGEEIA